MHVRVGCTFAYDCAENVPALMLVAPHAEPAHTVLEETWAATPEIARHGYRDRFGNQVERLLLPPGSISLTYDAIVEVDGEVDAAGFDAVENPVAALPDDVLVYTLSSRYCLTEHLSTVAWQKFGQITPGWTRVQAICDWIHENIRYGGIYSTPTTTAVDVYVAGGGMCRDFAHLAITFCRALNIPARYVFGYVPEFRPPEESTPMDFHAWFEVYLGDRWWPLDARFNKRLVGRVPVGYGRDAVDVAMLTTWGRAQFRAMTVWSDIVGNGDPVEHRATDPDHSEGLRLASITSNLDSDTA